jgi:uncharacterized delta-60 repeat protein
MSRLHLRATSLWHVCKFLPIAAVLLLALSISTNKAQAAVGDLDPAFGTGGRTLVDLQGDDSATAVALQPDGKLVIAGTSRNGPSTGLSSFAVARLNRDGSIDYTFGPGGAVVTNFPGSNAGAQALVIQPDGKIVVAGYASVAPVYNGGRFAVARYNPDGSIDTTFGAGGILTDAMFGFNAGASTVALQPDGKIVVAGGAPKSFIGSSAFAVARYNSNGSPDTTFGAGGRVGTEFYGPDGEDRVCKVLVQPDGKIVAVGYAFNITLSYQLYEYALARYNSNGTPDTTFGGSGQVTTNFGWHATALTAALQPDGKIVAAGSYQSSNDFSVARYNTNGDLDTSFGPGGTIRPSIYFDDEAHDVAIQSDGKIVVAGKTSTVASYPLHEFALIRLRPDGSFDPTFGIGGKLTTNFPADAQAASIAIQPDGNIIAAGWAKNSNVTGDIALARYIGDAPPPAPSPANIFEAALIRHLPLLKFDSQENYFTVAVESITDNPGNKLLRVSSPRTALLAQNPPTGTIPALSLNFLGDLYPGNVPSLKLDNLVEAPNHLNDAQRFQSDSRYADRIYGRVYYGKDENGRTYAWLQYWFFLYYNDYYRHTICCDTDEIYDHHEGDWEMIQILVNENAVPSLAVYAQHKSGAWQTWQQIERTGPNQDTPVVYVARGSHASYFTSGRKEIYLVVSYDVADGLLPRPYQRLEIMRDTTPAIDNPKLKQYSPRWVNWPGQWGGTTKREGNHPADGDSPRGPRFQGNKWDNPTAFFQSTSWVGP